ncbi:MAG: hypothetical protein LBP35_03610 [Candidatus Ancillula trichonymphae]|nr:hypothetical protein [Candidatus Ancillula trichonymphae]
MSGQVGQSARFSSGVCRHSMRLMSSDVVQMTVVGSDEVRVPWDALCPILQEKLKLAGIRPRA